MNPRFLRELAGDHQRGVCRSSSLEPRAPLPASLLVRLPHVVKPLLLGTAMIALSVPAPAAQNDEIYLRPGQLVAADGAHLNLHCTGKGSSTVLFDSGHQDWARAWAVVQPEVSKFVRACSFDRPGYGFSPAGPMPRTSKRIAIELRDALHAAGVHHRSLGSKPLRVITAAQHKPETIAAQARLLEVSSNAKQVLAQHSRNAYVQFDEPELVIQAIREEAGQ